AIEQPYPGLTGEARGQGVIVGDQARLCATRIAPDEKCVVCARRECLIRDSNRRAIHVESEWQAAGVDQGIGSADNADRGICQYARTVDGGIDRRAVCDAYCATN